MSKKKEFLILLLILAIATFFRLWQLDFIPPGLYPDEAINGNEALEKPGKIFYPENNGREGLFINLISLSFSLFGISIWALKIVPAIIGILTVFGLYLLTKELFLNQGKNENISRSVALISSFFLAISFWHLNFSRIAFRAILVPFILVFGFYFLFKGFWQKKFLNFIISGIFFGLGFYTYISYRFIVLLLPLVLFFWFLIYKRENLEKKYLSFLICYLSFIILIALPIGIYFLQNPQDFIARSASVSIFATENPLKELGKSLICHLRMFNFYGDPNWRHNFSPSPQLFWPIGILFLIGLFYSFSLLLKIPKIPLLGSGELLKIFVSAFLISWWLIMLLPGILTYEGIPHALRTIGTIPPVFIFVAIGTNFLFEKMRYFEKKRYSNILKNIGMLILVLVSFLIGFFEFYRYFFVWAKNPEVKNAFSGDYVEMGNYLNSLPPETKKYVIVNVSGVPVPYPNGIPMPAQTIMFIEETKGKRGTTIYLLLKELEKIKINSRETIILLMREDRDLFIKLREIFPTGKLEKKEKFWLFKI